MDDGPALVRALVRDSRYYIIYRHVLIAQHYARAQRRGALCSVLGERTIISRMETVDEISAGQVVISQIVHRVGPK